MTKAIDNLWGLYREVEGYAGKSGVDDVLYTAKVSLQTLEELAGAVLTNGGVHGTPERAWEVWQELAISTGDSLTAALGYGERWSLTGYLRAAGQVALDTAKNIADGANSANDTIRLVAIVVGLYFVVQLVKTGRGAAA